MTAVLPETTDTDRTADVQHAVCSNCYPQDGPLPDVIRAVCGTELPVAEWEYPDPDAPPPDDDDLCVVCADLVQYPCPRCGAQP